MLHHILFRTLFFIFTLAILFPLSAAAQDVIFDTDTDILLSSPAITITVSSGSVAGVVVVNAGTIVLTLEANGDAITLVSSSRDIKVAGGTSTLTKTATCASDVLTLVLDPGTSAETLTLTPLSGVCDGNPSISSVSATITNTTITASWTTDEASSSIIDYGLTSSYGSSTTETNISTRVTSHSETISGLVACVTYHYRVRSRDAALTQAIGSDRTFTTSGCLGSSAVTNESSSSITTAAGGSLSLGSEITITVPVSFAASDADFQIKSVSRSSVNAVTSPPSSLSGAGNLYDISALSSPTTNISSFDNSVTIALRYTAQDVNSVVESSMQIYRWNGSSWSVLSSCSINTSSRTVSCLTTAFSVFGIFGDTVAGGGGLPTGYFTAPVAPAGGFKISINNGSSTTQSRIVTLNLTVNSNISNMAISSHNSDLSDATQETYSQTKEWDLCSSYGGFIVSETCPSGLYTITAQFYSTYGGQPSSTVSAQIRYEPITSEIFPKEPDSTEPTPPEVVEEEPEQISETSPAEYSFSRNLTTGSTGEDVKELQKYLNNLGFTIAESGPGSLGQETTHFGSLTKAALIRFQNANAETILHPVGLLKGTGYFGASTRSAISGTQPTEQLIVEPDSTEPTPPEVIEDETEQLSSLSFTRNLAPNDIHDQVKILQELLSKDASIYPDPLITGYYGKLTTEAVQLFQLKYDVVSSTEDLGYGYVGPKTRAKLIEVLGQ